MSERKRKQTFDIDELFDINFLTFLECGAKINFLQTEYMNKCFICSFANGLFNANKSLYPSLENLKTQILSMFIDMYPEDANKLIDTETHINFLHDIANKYNTNLYIFNENGTLGYIYETPCNSPLSIMIYNKNEHYQLILPSNPDSVFDHEFIGDILSYHSKKQKN